MCGKVRKPIFSQRLAGFLLSMGFVLQSTDKDKNGSGRTVFYFNDSEELNKAMSEFLASRS